MKKDKIRKIVTILTIITTIGAVLSFFIPLYLSHKFGQSASSVGIIGGSDGPTVIFLTGPLYLHRSPFLLAFLSIVGIGYLFFTKK